MEWQRQLSSGKLFDGLSDTIRGPAEILIEDDAIAEVMKGGRTWRHGLLDILQ